MKEITITIDEAMILAQALNEVCNGPDSIDDIEFHSRMGATKSETLKLLNEIQQKISLSQKA